MLENFFKSLEIFLFWFQFHNKPELPDKNQKTAKNGSFLSSILQHSSETKTTEATLKISSWKSQKIGFLKTGGFPLVRIFFLYEQRPKLGHSSQVHPITGGSPMLRSCLLACWKGDWLKILGESRWECENCTFLKASKSPYRCANFLTLKILSHQLSLVITDN